MKYFIGRLLSHIKWKNYIIPNKYWKLVLKDNFAGTYMGIPIYKSKELNDIIK